jgi:hypothetical protein
MMENRCGVAKPICSHSIVRVTCFCCSLWSARAILNKTYESTERVLSLLSTEFAFETRLLLDIIAVLLFVSESQRHLCPLFGQAIENTELQPRE